MITVRRQMLLALALVLFCGLAGYAAQSGGEVAAAATVRVAALDLTSEQLEAADARERVERRVQSLRERGSRFVVMPGPLLRAGDWQAGTLGEPIPGATTQWLGALARRHDVWLVAPVFEAREKADAYLTLVLINPKGEIEHRMRAVLPNPAFGPLPVARGNFRDTLRSIDVGGLRVGILSGNDAVPGIMRLSDLGADVIFMAADLLEPPVAERMRGLAREGNVSIVVANRRAADGTQAFIVSAQGEVAQADADGNAMLGIGRVVRGWSPAAKLGLPPSVPQPNRIKASPELAELGRQLFIDTRFSETASVSCASCHSPVHSFSNAAVSGSGVHERLTRRNVSTLVNVAYRPLLRWDGYASSLENFIKYPMSGATEMNFHFLDKAAVLIRDDPAYRTSFATIFGAAEPGFDHIEMALAAYLRTILSGNSAFDRFYYGGESGALDEAQRRGLALFQGKARCAECHHIGARSALFSDFDYHDLGVGWQAGTGTYRDIGLGGISTAQFSGQFLTPSLRNVARTAPYMHDGSIATLRGVVDFIDGGGVASRGRSLKLTPLGLSEQEKDDLVSFLQALNGDAEWDAQGRPITNARAASHTTSSDGGSR